MNTWMKAQMIALYIRSNHNNLLSAFFYWGAACTCVNPIFWTKPHHSGLKPTKANQAHISFSVQNKCSCARSSERKGALKNTRWKVGLIDQSKSKNRLRQNTELLKASNLCRGLVLWQAYQVFNYSPSLPPPPPPPPDLILSSQFSCFSHSQVFHKVSQCTTHVTMHYK